ncbi:MAG: hypothetical protein KBC47_04665 [Candidatus Peribacteraceae bacterium]|nr:hypothetical protein [Candidatus Peribacteraceae bacterium]
MTTIDSSNYHLYIRLEADSRGLDCLTLTTLLAGTGIKQMVDQGKDVSLKEIRDILDERL